MVVWHLDRLARSATFCLVAAVLATGATGFLVAATSDVDDVLGALLVGALIVGIGGIAGSTVTSAVGIALLCGVSMLADPGIGPLGAVAAASVAALLLVDLSISLRRAPVVDRGVWQDLAVGLVAVIACAAALFGIAYAISKLATWQRIVVPFGVISIGYALRLAADAHLKRVGT